VTPCYVGFVWRASMFMYCMLAACGRVAFDPVGDAVAPEDDATGDGDGALASCGNGTVEASEQCDDSSGGCSACMLADQGTGGTCLAPTTLVLVPTTSGRAATATGDTSTSTNGSQVTCTPAGTLDRAYQITLTSATTLTITVTPTTNWNVAFAVRDAGLACTEATTFCCVTGATSGQPETSTCAVPAGSVLVVVDGASGNESGAYRLDVTAP
jgi:hypothetical protein